MFQEAVLYSPITAAACLRYHPAGIVSYSTCGNHAGSRGHSKRGRQGLTEAAGLRAVLLTGINLRWRLTKRGHRESFTEEGLKAVNCLYEETAGRLRRAPCQILVIEIYQVERHDLNLPYWAWSNCLDEDPVGILAYDAKPVPFPSNSQSLAADEPCLGVLRRG